ncbi:MAG: gliding motility-associated C-terminal domain-containing protein [Bacteroidia bacterium]|nr:gliding motility-associated C-terminal domain-containing protein [Bacteroidia bacterium]
MKKIYSLFSFVIITSFALAQDNKSAIVSHHHELTKQEIRQKAQSLTGYKSLDQIMATVSKHVVKNKSIEKEFMNYILPFVKTDVRYISVSIAEGKITKADLKKNYGVLLKKYKELYLNFEKDGAKKVKSAGNPIPFGPGQPCQNGDFETQTTTGWEGSYGSPLDPTITAGFDNPGINSGTGQHVIMTSGNDPNITAIPCVFPGGGGASFRLGDNGGGGNNSARLKQTFQVSAGVPYFVYHYAVVLEDAGHVVIEQPYFRVRMYDQGGTPISCATIDVDATNSTGLITSGSIKYKNWTTVLIPLTPYIGQDVTIEFTTADCDNSPPSGGSHDGYAYIDAECNYLPAIQQSAASICGGQNMTLTAPAGLGSYTWSGPGIVSGGSSQIATINQPGVYTVNMQTQTTPPNTPCSFTLTTTVAGNPSPVAAFTSNTVCVGSPTLFTDGSSVSAGSITNWAWDFDNNGSVDATSQNPTNTYPAAGTYTTSLTVTGPGGCTATTTATVTVSSTVTPNVTSVPTTCSNVPAFNLVANVGGGTWSGTGITDANLGTFDPSQASTGVNVITYAVTGACAGSDTIQINIVPGASPNWTAPAAMCADGASVNLNTLITGSTGGTWSGTGVSGNTFNPAGLSGNITVTYTVGTAPCVGTESHAITVTPNADATITQAGPLCSDAIGITLSGATPGGVWSGTGITDPNTGAFSPNQATVGNNIITYTISGACGDTDTMNVVIIQSGNPSYTLPPSICASGAPIDLNTLVTGTAGGTWSGPGVSGNIFNPSGLSGNQSITYTVGQGICQQTSTQTINVDGINAAFTATPTTGLSPLNVNFTNGSTNAVSYAWDLGNGQTSTATDPSSTYTATGSYVVTLIATNASGCADTATIIITVDELSNLVIPNVFTPNGDGSNDYFKPVLAEGLKTFKMVIYDRWGLKMSEVTNESLGWDGNAKNGSPAPDGTYYYIVTADGADGKEYKFTGYVSLIRAK